MLLESHRKHSRIPNAEHALATLDGAPTGKGAWSEAYLNETLDPPPSLHTVYYMIV